MSSALAVIEGEVVPSSLAVVKPLNAAELFRNATDVAGVCGAIVKQTAQAIQGRKYVRVEGWQAIATTFGCFASARDVERTTTGFRAIGEVRRMSDGAVLATAEGFVGDDESTWASRPEYAKRAMCQTRAISRACRSAFAFVVVMIDAELSTTPAEEVPDGGFNDASKAMPPPAGVDKLRQQVAPKPTPPRVGQIVDVPAGQPTPPGETFSVRYGKAKGKALEQLSLDELKWYEAGAAKSVEDPSKANYRAANEKELATLRAWVAYRS